ncbi:N-acyl-aromatic-L-amino acid amidohydrolase (carboxylate-forming) B-like [Polypterus senegalus]|nr:N-acyl-aromatic-L-amino acid amidohydrolase (carboxylate-forming) B-like [Polypterus senegalus]
MNQEGNGFNPPRQSLPPFSRVIVSGGTHGNELAGLYLVKQWLQGKARGLQRQTFSAKAVLSNPRASEVCRRYVDIDLNRCFTTERLNSPDADDMPYEIHRAKELNVLLGPKGSEQAVDFICDLHNTTSNMGVSVLVYQDCHCFNLHMFKYIQSHMKSAPVYCGIFNTPKDQAYSVDSAAKHGIGLEVGPQPHGVLRADILSHMAEALKLVLDFIDLYNQGTEFPSCEVEVYVKDKDFDFPKDPVTGELTATIHPERQDQDFQVMNPGDPLFQTFDGKTVNYSGSQPTYPFFINEAAYYEKNVAFSSSNKVSIRIPALRLQASAGGANRIS